jgi:mannose-6-phosphate isomerase-like protein (cupin superfamily)
MHVVHQDELPFSRIAREFVGADQGGVDISLLLVEAPPGRGPSLHRHAYHEVFIVQEGEAVFFEEDEEREVHGGEVVIVPPDTPHRFLNTGQVPLRLISIHLSPRFVTEWLDTP